MPVEPRAVRSGPRRCTGTGSKRTTDTNGDACGQCRRGRPGTADIGGAGRRTRRAQNFTGRPASLDVQGAPLGIAQRPGLRIPRAGTAPLLSTFTGAEVPRGVGEVSGFLQREPQDGTPSAFDTKVYLSYDQERLYAVFVCRDEPAEVRARVTRREGSGSDDSVSLYLDTFHDRRRAYVFTSNPYGVQSEHIRTEGQDDDDSFDTLWYTEAAMTPFGYVVKMTIPFRSLRFSGAPSQSWGIALSRRIQRLTEESYWPLVSKRVKSLVPQFAVARGLEHISPGANIQLAPYGAFTGARVGPAAAGEVDTTWRGGLDAKVGLGSALTSSTAAVNPDFSEVESDEPAGDGERALRGAVSREAAVLFGERRLLWDAGASVLLAPRPRPARGRNNDRQGRPVGDRRSRDAGPRHS